MNKKLKTGELLVKAGLISEAQILVALRDQEYSVNNYRIGEILSMRGWIDQKTINFFVDSFSELCRKDTRLRLGEYFIRANLLTQGQVDELLQLQRQRNIRIGSLAVTQNWIKQETLDFFLKSLFPEHISECALEIKVKTHSLQGQQNNSSLDREIQFFSKSDAREDKDSDVITSNNYEVLEDEYITTEELATFLTKLDSCENSSTEETNNNIYEVLVDEDNNSTIEDDMETEDNE